jgi:hypothetical protein
MFFCCKKSANNINKIGTNQGSNQADFLSAWPAHVRPAPFVACLCLLYIFFGLACLPVIFSGLPGLPV